MPIDIDVAAEAGEWPEERRLRALAESAVGAAVVEIGENLARRTATGGGSEGDTLELSLVFTDDAGIQRLNKDFRGKDRPTNVLSFPQEIGPPSWRCHTRGRNCSPGSGPCRKVA